MGKKTIPKVVVTVSGGCVQNVYASHPIEVELIDHDNYEDPEDDEDWVDSDELEKKLTEGMKTYL